MRHRIDENEDITLCKVHHNEIVSLRKTQSVAVGSMVIPAKPLVKKPVFVKKRPERRYLFPVRKLLDLSRLTEGERKEGDRQPMGRVKSLTVQ